MFKEKKTIVRLIVFLLAAVIAVGSITMGVTGLLHRDSGYYDVDYTPEGKATLYGSGVHLKYYADGGSSDIRLKINEVQKAYTDALLYIYRLLDETNTYESFVNIASLNAAPGEWLPIDENLNAALKGALEYTARNQGYSVFAGAVWQEWQTLLYLDEPQEKDPANDSEEADILRRLAEFLADPASFHLELADGKARLTVSEAYQNWARENEIDAPVLDLNLMKEAYLLQYVADTMTRQGYTAGYLYTDSGLSAALNLNGEMSYRLYRVKDGAPVEAGETKLPSPSAFCQFCAVPLNSEKYGYYTVTRDGSTLYRHPHFDCRTGEVHQLLMTAALGGRLDRLPDLAYTMTALTACATRREADALLSALPSNAFSDYSFQ